MLNEKRCVYGSLAAMVLAVVLLFVGLSWKLEALQTLGICGLSASAAFMVSYFMGYDAGRRDR
jgi:hypothetical protein